MLFPIPTCVSIICRSVKNLFKLYYVCHITSELRLLREKLPEADMYFELERATRAALWCSLVDFQKNHRDISLSQSKAQLFIRPNRSSAYGTKVQYPNSTIFRHT